MKTPKIHLPPGLKQAALQTVFAAKIRCRICGQGVPRKEWDQHAHG